MKKPKQINNNYKNICTIFNGKSNYLKNLVKRRNDGIRKINEKKREIFFEDYFNLNKFRRDYSCFSFDTLQEGNIVPVKFHISQNINMHNHVKIDKDFSRNTDDFPLKQIKKENNNNIYFFQKRKININYNNDTIKNRKKFRSVGNQIVSKSSMK